MQKINHSIKFILELTRTLSILNRRFDSALGGLSLNEFTILHNLNIATNEKKRRIDLANKVGLTASGVTRLLLPMEKIGLIKNGKNENDARTRYVMISSSGKRMLDKATEDMKFLLNELIPSKEKSKLKALSELIAEIGARTYIK